MITPDLLPTPDISIVSRKWPTGGITGWTAKALADVLKLARFGAWAAGDFGAHIDSIDGSDLQDAMERFGVLAKHQVTESCGDHCRCIEYGEFPHDCYRLTPGVAKIVKECGK